MVLILVMESGCDQTMGKNRELKHNDVCGRLIE